MAHTPVLPQGGQYDLRFHPGKTVTDASARSTSKRIVGERRQSLSEFWLPAFRTKRKRFVKPPWVPVHNDLGCR